jgi:hypothetical protein
MSNLWVPLAVPLIAAAATIILLAREAAARGGPQTLANRGVACIRKVNDWVYSESTGQLMARLTLEIRPAQGHPYPLWHVEWFIFPPAASQVTAGLELAVRIDPLDPKKVYPAVNWARRP